MSVLAIAGSPQENSRSRRLLDFLATELTQQGIIVEILNVRDLPAADLLHARVDSPALTNARAQVARADGILIATPVYKASYAGLLKAFLDLLPQNALQGKVVLPLATGGSLAHTLALDYGLRPVLAAIGSPYVLGSLYVLDSQLNDAADQTLQLEPDIDVRLREGLQRFLKALAGLAPTAVPGPIAAAPLRSVAA
jgi:FMN reductase